MSWITVVAFKITNCMKIQLPSTNACQKTSKFYLINDFSSPTGEKMLSPLVMCGPVGLEFLEPVTLNIPHCASSTPSLGLSVKATDSEKNLQTNWDNIDLPPSNTAHQVSVKVDHF